MRLIIAGGGTGGHLFPGIAVAEEFLVRDRGNEVLFVGTERGIEARVLPRLGYRLQCIAATGLRGTGISTRIKGVWFLLTGYVQSRKIVREFRPDLVLGVGGYASGPLVLAAERNGCPCFIHEQNALPGFTNRILAKRARQVFISLEESRRFMPEGKALLTGNPLRRQILESVQKERPAEGADGTFHLLVFGGSAGAHRINMAMVSALPRLGEIRERLSITHQTGEKDLAEVKSAYEKEGFQATVTPFIDDMAAAYGRADLIVCRAGATTIAEVTACGKPCVFVPFPYATDDHQRRNAEALVKWDAGFLILDRDLTGETLSSRILELSRVPERLRIVGENASRLARPDAAKAIVDAMLEIRGRV
ncbi:MAG: undecaprenyldiphospho-muramoylpentapeptide beta-N-acetylglucosaminyltransferase [Geobacteraceae bacterium]|nr:undecaprenyldiphospho-muramoylpentapeptide beta-N-acetylglucosaminyltransferase [Geobacteraceae bacterium]